MKALVHLLTKMKILMALIIESRHLSGMNYINLQPDKLCIVLFVILNLTLYFALGVRMIVTDQSIRNQL
jgi:hypothetical protein